MSLVHVGTLTLGECMPLAVKATAHLNASIGLVLPNLKARIEGLLDLQLHLSLNPPSLVAALKLALDLVASLEAAIALGLPSIDFQFAAVAALLAELQLDFGNIQVHVDFGLELDLVLGAGGIDLYAWEGPVAAMGVAIDDALAGGLPGGAAPGDACDAVVLAASSPVALTALAAMFRKAA